ncbi:hypothetical protein [Nocardia salmonicida]|uniref:hypothetical protein n=1 Tax=Nocardia salmonicida TaxID=53431 RepID=UPI00342E5CCA
MIEPLIPPQSAWDNHLHGPLVAPTVPRAANPNLTYGLVVVGASGRIADRAVLSAMGWRPTTTLAISCPDDRVLLVRAAPDGPITVTSSGFFHVPFRQRRKIGLHEGDLALLIAHREQRRLVITPPAVLDELTMSIRLMLEQPR